MTALSCDRVRDLLPEWNPATGDPTVAEHLVACGDCKAEAALLSMVRRAAPQVPPALEERVLRTARQRPRPRGWTGVRQLAIAATLVGALIGGSLLVEAIGKGNAGPGATGTGGAAAPADALLPVLEDPVLNSGSALSSLTEAELQSLLARMES